MWKKFRPFRHILGGGAEMRSKIDYLCHFLFLLSLELLGYQILRARINK